MKKSLGLIVGALLLLGFGCGPSISEKVSEKAVEKMIEKASGGKADIDLEDGKMKVTTKDGSAEWGGTKLPDNWPSDAPVYPGAEVQYSSSNTTADGKAGAMVVFATKDSGATVLDYYKKELAAQKWTIADTMQSGMAAILTGTKDNRTFYITIDQSEEDKQTNITVVLGNK